MGSPYVEPSSSNDMLSHQLLTMGLSQRLIGVAASRHIFERAQPLYVHHLLLPSFLLREFTGCLFGSLFRTFDYGESRIRVENLDLGYLQEL